MPRCDATGWRGRFGHASLVVMEETPVLSALEGGVLTLTLNRPGSANGMNILDQYKPDQSLKNLLE